MSWSGTLRERNPRARLLRSEDINIMTLGRGGVSPGQRRDEATFTRRKSFVSPPIAASRGGDGRDKLAKACPFSAFSRVLGRDGRLSRITCWGTVGFSNVLLGRFCQSPFVPVKLCRCTITPDEEVSNAGKEN